MRKRLALLAVTMFFITACVVPTLTPSMPLTPTSTQALSGQVATIDPSHVAHLPDPNLTPGDTLAVTAGDVCVSGYSSKVRSVTDAVKNQVYQEYGITSHPPNSYEVDHLISLELGGSNSIKNLWPEPYAGDWNAHVKDRIEDKLHSLVCNGSLDLATAQHEIATDWIAAYFKYIGQP